jgi:hypothetical protein
METIPGTGHQARILLLQCNITIATFRPATPSGTAIGGGQSTISQGLTNA